MPRVDRIRALEELKAAAAQVALARRESPGRARRHVGWARVLVAELPRTFDALRRGETTEWRAMIVARETIWLSARHRATVDAELRGRLPGLGDRQLEAEARRLAYRLDPQGFVARARRAEKDRRVALRPAPDTMARLTALLPVAQGVAAYAALRRHADAVLAAGDPRGRGQIMADTLVERVTGQATAEAVPVGVGLVVTDRTLLNRRGAGDDHGGADEAAQVDGYGPIPADLAPRLVADAPADAGAWLRRLYTDPSSGQLVVMESRARCFDGALRDFLVIRDQACRIPWCGAPVRHGDHVEPVAEGGVTSAANGQGLCAACNYAKQTPGWSARCDGGSGDDVVTTTPTGHRYRSRATDPPGAARPARPAVSVTEAELRRLLRAA